MTCGHDCSDQLIGVDVIGWYEENWVECKIAVEQMNLFFEDVVGKDVRLF